MFIKSLSNIDRSGITSESFGSVIPIERYHIQNSNGTLASIVPDSQLCGLAPRPHLSAFRGSNGVALQSSCTWTVWRRHTPFDSTVRSDGVGGARQIQGILSEHWPDPIFGACENCGQSIGLIISSIREKNRVSKLLYDFFPNLPLLFLNTPEMLYGGAIPHLIRQCAQMGSAAPDRSNNPCPMTVKRGILSEHWPDPIFGACENCGQSIGLIISSIREKNRVMFWLVLFTTALLFSVSSAGEKIGVSAEGDTPIMEFSDASFQEVANDVNIDFGEAPEVEIDITNK
eukprot:sb/3467724/